MSKKPPKPIKQERKEDSDDELELITQRLDKLPKTVSREDKNDVSDESPDSSDSEYGAKTVMRRLKNYVRNVPKKRYVINDAGAEEVSFKEIQNNPGKYFVATFRGDYLKYFDSNLERREGVKKAVDGTVTEKPEGYKSIAISKIERSHSLGSEEYKKAVSTIRRSKTLSNTDFIRKYKSPAHFVSAVKEISPEHGNPMISTSKDTKITVRYADHPDSADTLHPKYSARKKPKHRLIGMTTVSVYEANEYLAKEKADIEHLRKKGEIGGKSAIERENEEIIFEGEIDSKNIAGYVPLAYPNLSKKYVRDDKELFGLDAPGKKWSVTRKDPKTLGTTSKEHSIYRVNQVMQWKLAEKYIERMNPDGELIWVDNDGKFRKFRGNEVFKKDKITKSMVGEVEELKNPESKEDEDSKISRVENPNDFYADDELNFLISQNIQNNECYISPAVAALEGDFGDAINNFINDAEKNRATVVIAANNHFTSINISKNENGSFSIYHFDSVASGDGKPLHEIPNHILEVMNEKFPGVEIQSSSTIVQTYQYEGEFFVIDNNHCGAFVSCVSREIAKGNLRINLDKSNKLQIEISQDNWIDFQNLTADQSDDLGKRIRNCHLKILRGEEVLDNESQISILRNFVLEIQEKEFSKDEKSAEKVSATTKPIASQNLSNENKDGISLPN